jgi:hypothetical protein
MSLKSANSTVKDCFEVLMASTPGKVNATVLQFVELAVQPIPILGIIM